MAQFHLSVVGIFVKVELTVSNPTPTVEELLNELKTLTAGKTITSSYGNLMNFSFNPPPAGVKPMVGTLTVTHTDPFQSRSCHRYAAGEYSLTENIGNGPTDMIWQYYVLDKDGKSVPLEHCSTGGNNPQPSYIVTKVPEGGQVIWRLVSILTGPNEKSPVLKGRH